MGRTMSGRATVIAIAIRKYVGESYYGGGSLAFTMTLCYLPFLVPDHLPAVRARPRRIYTAGLRSAVPSLRG